MRFAGAVPAAKFEAIPGVGKVVVEDHSLRMNVHGPIAPVVRAAAAFDLIDFTSREPSLEEVFLAEYEREAVDVG
jgi:ABC-2 type transport system ATP-binding protein